MKSRHKARYRTVVKKRKLRFIRRLTTLVSETTRKLWNQTFEFWKTLPDSMKTAVILSFLSVSAGLLAPAIKSIRNCAELQQPPPNVGETICTDSRSVALSRPSSQRLKSSQTMRQIQRLNSSSRTIVNERDDRKLQVLANARQAVRLGNYGDAFRQLRLISETLPRTERSGLAEDIAEANKMYERGEFREAAYKVRDKVEAVLSTNLNQPQ